MAKGLLAQVPADKLPVHIGLILDGNGRWATRRGLPRTAGHRQGVKVFGEIAQYCREIGIQYLTAYTFSTENWKRSKGEVKTIMDLLRRYLDEAFQNQKEDACVRFLGDRTPLAPDLVEKMQRIEEESAKNDRIHINIALNYGGRDEIVRAVRTLAQRCVDGTVSPSEISEQMVSDCLYTCGQPDPDMILRPSGEMRTSNFLPWQSTYAELVFMDVLWPDFTPNHLDQAILQYLQRSRRFGGV